MRIMFILLCTLLIQASCKKDKDIKEEITANLGTFKADFSNNAYAAKMDSSGYYQLKIFGDGGIAAPPSSITIIIESPIPIAAGLYSELNPGGSARLVRFTPCGYIPNFDCGFNFQSTQNPVKVTISEITDDYVKGFFHGDVKYNSAIVTQQTFSNGKFAVRF